MRKLTSPEIENIHARLKSLHIRYTEVYAEIFDHYCTTLENASEVEPNAVFAQLNETFAWSVVKRMDKNRRKASNQQVNNMQLGSLKVWKLNTISLLILSITVTAALSISYWLGTFALISFAGMIGLLGIILVLIKHRSSLNFSLNPWKESPTNSFSNVLYSRFTPFLGILPYAFVGFYKINLDRLYAGSQFFTFSNLAFLLLLLHGLSIIKVVMDYQAPKLQPSDKI